MLTTAKETIGALDSRIALYTRSTTVNDYGESTETFTLLASVWAKVEYPITGSNESQEARVNLFEQRVDFTIRSRSDIDQTSRIVYDGKTYDIERITEIWRNAYLKLTCEYRK